MKVYLVYFSPSGTTQRTLENIAKGFPGVEVEHINLLPSENRRKTYRFGAADLVILGSATAGAVMGHPDELFGCLEGNNTPLVAVGVCGGTTIGIAMRQMHKRTTDRGFLVTAMGVFIGQYSCIEGVGVGRPNDEDAAMQAQFGRDLYRKIVVDKDFTLHGDIPETIHNPAVRGTADDGEYILPATFKEKSVSDDCILCMTCERNCPTDATDIRRRHFDLEKCVACWACISRCPTKAITPGPAIYAGMASVPEEFRKATIEPQVVF